MIKKIFDREEWNKLREGLPKADAWLNEYRSQPKPERDVELLDKALRCLWKFAEYTLNALREAEGERVDRGHAMDQTAKIYYAAGILKANYSQRLEQLEKYRKKSDYGDYARERSVHYTAANLQDCLEAMLALEGEAEAHLRAKGFL